MYFEMYNNTKYKRHDSLRQLARQGQISVHRAERQRCNEGTHVASNSSIFTAWAAFPHIGCFMYLFINYFFATSQIRIFFINIYLCNTSKHTHTHTHTHVRTHTHTHVHLYIYIYLYMHVCCITLHLHAVNTRHVSSIDPSGGW